MGEYDRELYQKYWNQGSDYYSRTIVDDIREGIGENWMGLIRPRMPQRRMEVLDCCCGPGFFSIMMGKEGHDVTGIDFSEGMLEHAKANCREFGIEPRFLQMDAENLQFEDGSFDMVVSRNAMWNMPHPEKAYGEIMRVLRKGGYACIIDASYHEMDRSEFDRKPTKEDLERNPYMRHDPYENGERVNPDGSSLPMGKVARPEWDISILKRFDIDSIDIVFRDNFNFYPSEDGVPSRKNFFLLWVKKR